MNEFKKRKMKPMVVWMIGMIVWMFGVSGIALSTSSFVPQAVKASPALVLEPQVSLPLGQQGMLVAKTDGNLYYYDFGWKKVKLVPAN